MKLLLASRDLAAKARLADAAERAGWTMVTARVGDLSWAVSEHSPELVVVDLDEAGEPVLQALGSAPRARMIGFFSHVDRALGDAARAAGVEAVPRGRFWRTLPQLFEAQTAQIDRKGEDMTDKERSADPQQPEEGGFEEGQDHKPDSPEEGQVGNFAEGQDDPLDEEDEERRSRFSEGQEDLPDTPEKEAEGSFAEGQEGH